MAIEEIDVAVLESTETISTPDGDLGLATARPADATDPLRVVVLLHHGPGLDLGTRDAIKLFADQHYLVVAPDRYHRRGAFLSYAIHRPDGSLDPNIMARSRSALLNTDDDMVARDLDAVIDYVSGRDDAAIGPHALVGYCVGARSMLFALRDRPGQFVAGIGFHPSFCVPATTPADGSTLEGILAAPAPLSGVPDITVPVALFIGTADQISSVQTNAALIDAVRDLPDGRGEVVLVEGADHGFAVPGQAWQDGTSDAAYAEAFEFLDHRLV